MQFLLDILSFLSEKTFLQLVYYFWYFLIFDFCRYVVSDLIFVNFYLWRKKRSKPAIDNARARLFIECPLISVIVPGKNEGRHIPRLAQSLHEQTYTNLEIIIVDDGSDDNSAEICRNLQSRGIIDLFFRQEDRGGKASAANLALRYARGKYVVHLDADSHLKEDSIEQIIAPFFRDPKIGVVGGDIRVKNVNESLATSLQAVDYMKSISTGRVVNSTIGILRIVSGAYGAFRMDILRRLKGWDVGPGLDGDITIKIRKLGFKIYHESDAVCYTNVPNTFVKLTKQRLRWDRSLVRFRVRKHGDLLSLKNRNFMWQNFFSAMDNLLFNLVLNFKWWVYFVQVVFFNTSLLPIILTMNYFFYLIFNIIEFTLACRVYGRSLRGRELFLLFYLPLMPFYTGFFLRFIRTYAHIMELFFKASFMDAWNPWKVSKISKQQKF